MYIFIVSHEGHNTPFGGAIDPLEKATKNMKLPFKVAIVYHHRAALYK